MNIYGFTLEKLQEYFEEIGENPAKAKIVFNGIYKNDAADFRGFGFADRITARLEKDFSFSLPEVVQKNESADAAKLLLKLSDGEFVETVLMRQRFGNCVCVSTQIGCNMGCKFCQSGLMKKRRDLELSEIVGQVLALSREFSCKIDGVSVMGIGEPFDNLDAVCEFCDLISDDNGLAIGRRHITVSTCGIVPGIRAFAERPRSYSLALSLHAPNDELRSEIMPINRKYPIGELLEAAEYFSEKTHKRVTLEYVLLGGFNDAPEHAVMLSRLIKGRDFYVNLIPYNATDSAFRKPADGKLSEFCKILKENGVIATKRREFGAGLKAACGQLSADYRKAAVSNTDTEKM